MGRSPDCQVHIPNNAVSRQHAKIIRKPNGFYIEDLKSRNGTLVNNQAIIAVLKPQPSGEPAADKGYGGTEKLTSAPTKPVPLPPWAESLLKSLQLPKWDLTPTDTTLSNGIRLIVQPEKLSPLL